MRKKRTEFMAKVLWLLIPLIPVVLGAIVLEIYGPSGQPLTYRELKYLLEIDVDFASGKITYVAVTALHYTVCAIIIIRYFILYKDSSGSTKAILRGFIVPGCFVFVLFVLFSLLAKEQNFNIHTLSSVNMSEIYGLSNGLHRTQWPVFSSCEFWFASTLPVFTAVVSAIVLVAFSNAQIYLFTKECEYSSCYFVYFRSITQHLLPVYPLLVTGVISSATWFHLPVKIYRSELGPEANEIQKSVLQKLQYYGDEMTLFWGMTYTLIALAAVTCPIWRLSCSSRRKLYLYESVSTGQSRNERIQFSWMTRQTMGILAPLITSLLANLLEEG